MVKVSIIIPIYNAEKYLEKCIKSVFSQTLKELEIVCIDDGSTDDSVQIVKQFIAKDIRICLLCQENQGAGVARNRALDMAKGKYVAFLDADDYYIDERALELMVNTCEKTGISACGSLRKFNENGVVTVSPLFQNVDKGKYLDYQDYQIDYDYQSFIFLKEIIVKNHICFPKYRRFQDPPFLVKVLYEAKQFMVVDTYLYCYRVFSPITRFNYTNACDLLYGLIDNLIFAKDNNLEKLFYNTALRLEYEYRNIILKNINSEDLCLLNLLIQANQIICKQLKKTNYIIKPLRMILLYVEQYEKKLLKKIKEEDKIVLYGAGKYGRIFLKFLKQNQLIDKVEYIVVSDLKENEASLENIPVITLNDLNKSEKKQVFVTVREEIQLEIKENLDKNGYQNYEIVKDEFLGALE